MFGLTLKSKLDKANLEIKELQKENKVLECKAEWRDRIIGADDRLIENMKKAIERYSSQVRNRDILIKDLQREIDLLEKSFKEIK